jgi:hypothetical protein
MNVKHTEPVEIVVWEVGHVVIILWKSSGVQTQTTSTIHGIGTDAGDQS